MNASVPSLYEVPLGACSCFNSAVPPSRDEGSSLFVPQERGVEGFPVGVSAAGAIGSLVGAVAAGILGESGAIVPLMIVQGGSYVLGRLWWPGSPPPMARRSASRSAIAKTRQRSNHRDGGRSPDTRH